MKKAMIFFIIWAGMCTFCAGYVLAGEEGVSNTLYGQGAGPSITGNVNATFIGAYAGNANTTGDSNTFIGKNAGFINTLGNANTFIGQNAGFQNTDGNGNTFLGYFAGRINTSGDRNTFLGYYTGEHNETGTDNTFIGNNAGRNNTTGSSNTFLGHRAGYQNTTGFLNVFIGYRAGYNETGSNKLYIDNTDTGNPLIYGEFDNDLVKIHGTLEMAEAVSISDARMKKNVQPLNSSLNKVSLLEGVSFNWKTEEYAEMGFSDDMQVGLIAQEVEKVLPELVRTGTDGYKSVSYAKLTAVLVEAVKELKSGQEELKDDNQALKTQIEELKKLKNENQVLKAQIEKNQVMLEAILKNSTYLSLSSSSNWMAAGDIE